MGEIRPLLDTLRSARYLMEQFNSIVESDYAALDKITREGEDYVAARLGLIAPPSQSLNIQEMQATTAEISIILYRT